MALVQQDHKDLPNASLVSTSEVKLYRNKLIASTPTDSEGFMMMLKIFENLLFALFSLSFLLYKQVYAIIKAVREYSPNARAGLQHNTKTIILCILLLQSRIFEQVKVVGT